MAIFSWGALYFNLLNGMRFISEVPVLRGLSALQTSISTRQKGHFVKNSKWVSKSEKWINLTGVLLNVCMQSLGAWSPVGAEIITRRSINGLQKCLQTDIRLYQILRWLKSCKNFTINCTEYLCICNGFPVVWKKIVLFFDNSVARTLQHKPITAMIFFGSTGILFLHRVKYVCYVHQV